MRLYVIYLLMLIFSSFSCSLQVTEKNKTIMEASKKLQISKNDLDSLISELNILDSNSVGINESIQMVRVYNTIGWYNLSGDFYNQYIKRTNDINYYRIIDVLEMTRWKTGSSYSKKYDIHLGGPPHENSQYKIK